MAVVRNASSDFPQDINKVHSKDSDQTREGIMPASWREPERQLQAPTHHAFPSHPLAKCGSMTSLKEVESQNNQLKRENFDLKLRLYMLEEKKGLRMPAAAAAPGWC